MPTTPTQWQLGLLTYSVDTAFAYNRVSRHRCRALVKELKHERPDRDRAQKWLDKIETEYNEFCALMDPINKRIKEVDATESLFRKYDSLVDDRFWNLNTRTSLRPDEEAQAEDIISYLDWRVEFIPFVKEVNANRLKCQTLGESYYYRYISARRLLKRYLTEVLPASTPSHVLSPVNINLSRTNVIQVDVKSRPQSQGAEAGSENKE